MLPSEHIQESRGQDQGEEILAVPPCDLVVVRPAREVDDVDEEVFLLWTLNPMPAVDAGLGYVSHSHDVLYLAIDGEQWHWAHTPLDLEADRIVKISQEITSLRSDKGNTGSIVWRSTLLLAVAIRQGRLLNLDNLRHATVLELGSGTGALVALIAAQTKKWIATDQSELLPLLRRNLAGVANSEAYQLDWFDFLRPPSASFRKRSLQSILTHLDDDFPDVVLCADCVYNPALFEALTTTLTEFAQPKRTVVLVVAEMRTDEVIADFLAAWQQSHPDWQILSLEDRLGKGFVAFAAWRT